MDRLLLDGVETGRTSHLLEPGYIFAPYVNSIVISFDPISKQVRRRRIINKVFSLGIIDDIIDEFSPSRSIMSRYSNCVSGSNLTTMSSVKL